MRQPEGPLERNATLARFTTLSVLYFASGAVGLVDEVIFFKYLSLSFGATAQASSAVLVAFMAGLALGSTAAARLDARVSRPLLLYGVLEIAVGVACAVSPALFGAVAHVYASMASATTSLATLEVVRGALAGAVVLLPTAAMGATLPLIARVAGSADGGERRVAALYGANTAGGAVGSLLGAYLVVPSLGLATSLRAGACVSVLVGMAAIALARQEAPRPGTDGSPAATATSRDADPRRLSGLMVATAASGLLVFASEVIFVHLLALVDGTSVYVFGLVLAVFLVALALGAFASQGMVRWAGDGALAASLALSGLVVAVTVPVWERLPGVFVAAGPHAAAWWQREVVRGLVAALAIGLPATCMGTTFPIVLASLAKREDRGAQTGRVTAANTLASIAGSLLGGFVALPVLGSQRACGAIAIAYALAALAVPSPRRWVVATAGVATAALVALAPRWDLTRLSSGTNVYFEAQPAAGTRRVDRRGRPRRRRDRHGERRRHDAVDQRQVPGRHGVADDAPARLRRYPRRVRAALRSRARRWPGDRRDARGVREVSVRADRRGGALTGHREGRALFFGDVNDHVLDDPRVSVLFEDGRNLLLVGPASYDLVTIEITSIWFAGAANLYNRELYEAAARRLTDGGVLSQWIQLHHTTLLEVASQVATARSVFAHAALFVRGQGVLVMSATPLHARPDAESVGPRAGRRDAGRLRERGVRASGGVPRGARLHGRQPATGICHPSAQRARGPDGEGRLARDRGGRRSRRAFARDSLETPRWSSRGGTSSTAT